MGKRELWIAGGFVLMFTGICLMRDLSTHAAAAVEPAERTPVLVELFTSEGCSSCPPADQLLVQLAAQNTAVPGVEIIAMSEHVDYWNSQGWADPFSDPQFSRRQDDYAQALKSDPYTPQMVVDGKTEFVGSDRGNAMRAFASAGQKPKASLTITKIGDEATGEKFQIRMAPMAGFNPRDPFDVYLAVTEDNLSSNVARGENKGHKLSHAGVVRKMNLIGCGDDTGGFTGTQTMQIDRKWKPADLHIIAFAQSRKSRAIVAASTVRLKS